MERKIIVISGPTASGKTEFSIHLAAKLNTEIISADSRQFYKFLNIGTAKPSYDNLLKVKHHLIDFLNPDEEYNISLFRKDALTICEDLWIKNKIPIITGGSGLYIKSLTEGLSDTPDADAEIRSQLLKERELYGNQYIYDKLKALDPTSACSMLPQNWKRIIRALEVYYLTGKPIWEHHNQQQEVRIKSEHYFLNWDRKTLYERINERVDKMIDCGLVEEVRELLNSGYTKELNSLNTVGYKEIIEFLDGMISLEKAVELIKRNSRRYAKRQVTWFRKQSDVNWLSIESSEDLYIFAGKIAEGNLNER